jgi:predicted amidohydrolase
MSGSDTRELALVQFEPVLLDRAASERRLAPLLARAAGADLVVLPELAATGYGLADAAEVGRASEEVGDSRFLDFLAAQCAAHGFDVVTGFAERSGAARYNSAVLVGAEGPVATYRKLHLFDREKQRFAPGDLGVPVAERRGMRVAMLVCFDWAFPEVWRLAALGGADVVAHPANLVLVGYAQRAVPVHAQINGYAVVTANRVGEERGLRFTGGSLIAAPRGEVLARAPEEGEAVVRATVDLARIRDKGVTPQNDLLGDRRPDCYGPLTAARP